jgi:hypothetical protein
MKKKSNLSAAGDVDVTASTVRLKVEKASVKSDPVECSLGKDLSRNNNQKARTMHS